MVFFGLQVDGSITGGTFKRQLTITVLLYAISKRVYFYVSETKRATGKTSTS